MRLCARFRFQSRSRRSEIQNQSHENHEINLYAEAGLKQSGNDSRLNGFGRDQMDRNSVPCAQAVHNWVMSEPPKGFEP